MESQVDADLEVWGASLLEGDPGTYRRTWLIRGPEGAVHFVYGDWHPDAPAEVRALDTEFVIKFGHPLMPMGYDVGYHSLAPMNALQLERGPVGVCEWLDGRPCYGDGSSLRAQEVFSEWLARDRDLEWLFEYLRGYYRAVFRSDGNGPTEFGDYLLMISALLEDHPIPGPEDET